MKKAGEFGGHWKKLGSSLYLQVWLLPTVGLWIASCPLTFQQNTQTEDLRVPLLHSSQLHSDAPSANLSGPAFAKQLQTLIGTSEDSGWEPSGDPGGHNSQSFVEDAAS